MIEDGLIPESPVWGKVRGVYGCRSCCSPVTETVDSEDVKRITEELNDTYASEHYVTVFKDGYGQTISMRKWRGRSCKLLSDEDA